MKNEKTRNTHNNFFLIPLLNGMELMAKENKKNGEK